jgi:hypothetical protein
MKSRIIPGFSHFNMGYYQERIAHIFFWSTLILSDEKQLSIFAQY